MDAASTGQPVFELLDAELARSLPEVIGLWQTQAPLPEEGVSFGAGSASMAEATVWRTNLPSDPDKAQTCLAAGERRLNLSHKALESAAARMDALLGGRTAHASFGVLPAEATGRAESELLRLLDEIRRGSRPASYGLADKISGGWQEAAQNFHRVLERLQKFVMYYAWVETRVRERFLGRTAVTWGGDTRTIWAAELDAEQVRLHRRSLALALGSRDALLQMFALTARYAVKLSVLATMPGGMVLVLPVAWKFIHQVMAESQL